MGVDEEHMKVGPLAVERYAVSEPQQAQVSAHRCRRRWTSFGSRSTGSNGHLSTKTRFTPVGATAIKEGFTMEMVDLSRLIYDGMPKIPVLPDVHVQKVFQSREGPSAQCHRIVACPVMPALTSTRRFISCQTANRSKQLPLDAFVGAGAVIGVKKKGGEEVTAKDLEISGVAVNRGDILMLYTGWDEKFDSPDYNLHPYLVGGCRGMDGEKGHQDVRHRLHHSGSCRRRSGRRDLIFQCTKRCSGMKS